MGHGTRGVLFAVVIVLVSENASATVTLLGQRRIDVATGLLDAEFLEPVSDGPHFSEATNFGFWDDAVVADATHLFGFGRASAVQETTISELVPGSVAHAEGGGADLPGDFRTG